MADLSLWDALGNRYVVAEGLTSTPEVVREHVRRGGWHRRGARGRRGRASVRIWNPDGSTAELSGNGTRIAALARRPYWLSRGGVRVGDRVVRLACSHGLVEDGRRGPVRVHPARACRRPRR